MCSVTNGNTILGPFQKVLQARFELVTCRRQEIVRLQNIKNNLIKYTHVIVNLSEYFTSPQYIHNNILITVPAHVHLTYVVTNLFNSRILIIEYRPQNTKFVVFIRDNIRVVEVYFFTILFNSIVQQ